LRPGAHGQRCRTVRGDHDVAAAELRQRASHHAPHGGIVLDDKNA
jgi:hypothetical protein